MTAVEAAAAWGLSKNHVVKLCATGRIPGVRKVRSKHGQLMYDIPVGTPRPVLERGRHAVSKLAAIEPRDIADGVRKMPNLKGRTKTRYIWDCQSKYTIGELAAKLGITCSKVVQLYDRSFRTFQDTGGSMR